MVELYCNMLRKTKDQLILEIFKVVEPRSNNVKVVEPRSNVKVVEPRTTNDSKKKLTFTYYLVRRLFFWWFLEISIPLGKTCGEKMIEYYKVRSQINLTVSGRVIYK